jgi:hypothetical protein
MMVSRTIWASVVSLTSSPCGVHAETNIPTAMAVKINPESKTSLRVMVFVLLQAMDVKDLCA